ncbi:MAG: protein-S-isoprenylcysteine O-methyltransferase [Cystobacter sp.]
MFLLGLVLQVVIRRPHDRARRQTRVATDRIGTAEKLVLSVLFLGVLLPGVYIFTPVLRFADYGLPPGAAAWVGGAGGLLMGVALWLFWHAHADLGRNWSPSLQLMEHHSLVTGGIYRFVRHPMYASQWVFALAQALLLQNWIAGPATLICFAPLYFIRVPREEAMMLERFGETYRTYMVHTGRVLPRRSVG